MSEYDCDYCEAQFDSHAALGGHVTSVHRYGDYECAECGAILESLAKYRAHRSGHARKLSRETLVSELRRLANELGRPPAKSDMDSRGTYSTTTYRNEFGSWTGALAVLDYEPIQAERVSDGALLDAIRDLAAELGRPPTAVEMDNRGAHSQRTCANRFGSWAQAVRRAGFEPRGQPEVTGDALLAEIDRLAAELGRAPTPTDMNEDGAYHSATYYDYFDSWPDAVQQAGYRPASHSPELASDHHRDGPWPDDESSRQRVRALERDNYRCQTPGCEMTAEKHREQYGCGLHVHHITPRREFLDESGAYDAEAANALENLITLCVSHHRFWEQLAPLRPDTR